ncbi:MAG: DUF2807 domain-containing protein [Bacteroidota bacterium]
MRTYLLVLVLILPLGLIAQRRPKIKGNRDVIIVDQPLSAFHTVVLQDNLTLELRKATNPGYTITADANLIEVLRFEVVDSILEVSSFYDIVAKKQMEITIYCPELRGITVNKGKIVNNTMMMADKLSLKVRGDARLDIEANAISADLMVADRARIDLNLDVDNLNVNMTDKTEGTLYATSDRQSISIGNNVVLDLQGRVDTLQVLMVDASKLRAAQLLADHVDLSVQDASIARIRAQNSFNLEAGATSKTWLYGNPTITIEAFIEAAQLHKKQD